MSEPRSYLVCASQRSGSTLLVESLRATTVAGNPEEFFQYLPSTSRSPQPRQWFEGVTDEAVLSLLAPLEPGTADTRTAEQWRDQLLSLGRTPNGVWGGKLMWNQVPLVLDRAAGLPDRSGDDLRSALDDILGRDLAFIHVYRRDVVAQAVSMWRAVQTQVWRDDATPPAPHDGAEYHADGIAHLIRILRDQDEQWRNWFEVEGLDHIDIGFDDLVAAPQATAAKVLVELGLDADLAPPPPLKRQSDGRSKEWVERYRSDAAANGLPL
ncbi:trehalose 2-sulfotransferase [Rhodococcus opacus]|uniref:Trehalose 2-sulfotransferase n=1 Tax=Rhodococcus opacus TaxID=37919 RepID=A0A2S8JBK5_RHOOP|nr:Stf0 family sulfotransferase [Rhodococcus opacus]PQP24323.1 sulfotransferase [Rhodococcus opacus]